MPHRRRGARSAPGLCGAPHSTLVALPEVPGAATPKGWSSGASRGAGGPPRTNVGGGAFQPSAGRVAGPSGAGAPPGDVVQSPGEAQPCVDGGAAASRSQNPGGLEGGVLGGALSQAAVIQVEEEVCWALRSAKSSAGTKPGVNPDASHADVHGAGAASGASTQQSGGSGRNRRRNRGDRSKSGGGARDTLAARAIVAIRSRMGPEAEAMELVLALHSALSDGTSPRFGSPRREGTLHRAWRTRAQLPLGKRAGDELPGQTLRSALKDADAWMERWEGVRVFGAVGSLYSTALATLHTDLLRVQVDVGMQVELRQLRADDEELLCGWPNADDDDMRRLGDLIGDPLASKLDKGEVKTLARLLRAMESLRRREPSPGGVTTGDFHTMLRRRSRARESAASAGVMALVFDDETLTASASAWDRLLSEARDLQTPTTRRWERPRARPEQGCVDTAAMHELWHRDDDLGLDDDDYEDYLAHEAGFGATFDPYDDDLDLNYNYYNTKSKSSLPASRLTGPNSNVDDPPICLPSARGDSENVIDLTKNTYHCNFTEEFESNSFEDDTNDESSTFEGVSDDEFSA